MFKILFSKKAAKDFRKIDKRYQKAIGKSLDILEKFPRYGKPLVGQLKGYFAIRVSKIRIIYTTNHKKKVIEIKAIGFRKEVYKKSL